MISYQLALIFAGFIYIVTPGPVFLAIISMVSEQGRKDGLKFITGAIFGCMVWFTFTATTIISVEFLPDWLFIILALACASYLLLLAYKMFLTSTSNREQKLFKYPFRDGLVLALLNPKSYPVMAAVFGAIALEYPVLLSWDMFLPFFIFSVSGFYMGYLFMIGISGFRHVKNFYIKHIDIVRKFFGLVFLYFAIILVMNSGII